MEAKIITTGGYYCTAWRVSEGEWHASATTRRGSIMNGSGATAHAAAEDAARLARTLDDGTRDEKEALAEQLRRDAGGVTMGTTKTLRAQALTRTLATIRGRFPRIADDEADELAALLLRSADGRAVVRFWRGSPGETHAAEFSRLRHDAVGDAFYVSRIE